MVRTPYTLFVLLSYSLTIHALTTRYAALER